MSGAAPQTPLGWAGIVRLGLVQACLGAVVVLTTSIMNRVMVVELALPAVLPGVLVAWHYAVQVLRPRLGHGSDVGGTRTPWIIGGMAALAVGGVGAAIATGLMATNLPAGVALAILSFTVIGLGVGAGGTSLLVLMSRRVAPDRRPAAATIAWLMMFAGFVVTAATAGHFLDPYTPARLVTVTAAVGATAMALTLLAVWRVEGPPEAPAPGAAHSSFMEALRETWQEPQSRRFAWFVFVSMLAYSAQELILDPFAGAVFGYTPGASTRLSGMLHGGALLGMILVAAASLAGRRTALADMRTWTMGGCAASALMLLVLCAGGLVGPAWPLRPTVFLLGMANGSFAVAAIGAMMQLVGTGQSGRAGVRMGLWGAAQAVAFACGGLLATAASDIARALLADQAAAYGLVFLFQTALFLLAARLAARVFLTGLAPARRSLPTPNPAAVAASGG